MSEGRFTIPTRLYLTQAQRARLQHLLLTEERELDDLVTELIEAHLATAPEPPPEQARAVGDATAEELRRRRTELRRLRPSVNDPHNPPPQWLVQMVAELESEVRRLEQLAGG